ncbi:bifunctional 2-polyprenyl-6-hydroxyphenol methylase/3-demethylubiquinol 3-O-methyltransferase UbiG [Polaromonas sp. A23]|uniref:class I SAM-dependent methyltransferase n=1 Tax=Polaromonas sp. A23 TaxID=1944133 RepID=UPI00143A89BF|nr:class I SAM-dependent methyltransferase [Polaromonas sp. A23]
MDIATQYERQSAWRDWRTAYRALPDLKGKKVLDLGCAVGTQSRDLAELGAAVVGVELDPKLLAVARSKNIPRATFLLGDIRDAFPTEPVDGIWSSFVTAYFPDLEPVLRKWRSALKPGGWLALTEVDDMFGHEPLSVRAAQILNAFAKDALIAKRYDFSMGSKLASQMKLAGFQDVKELSLNDQELSFTGPASREILDAWADRFDRMKSLQMTAGEEFEQLRKDFLECLAHPEHRVTARVCFCVGFLPDCAS